MNSSSKVARETLDAIHNEASNEIIEKLLDLVEKILIRARMIDNEYLFKKRGVLSKDLLHATIVKFSALESRQVLPAPWRRESLHVHGRLAVGRPVAREVPLPTSPQSHGAQDCFFAFQCFVLY